MNAASGIVEAVPAAAANAAPGGSAPGAPGIPPTWTSSAKDLVTTAEAWAASKPPAHPVACGSDEVRAATTKVAREAKALAALVESGAGDAKLKEALKGVHDAFEVAEHGCGGHG